MANYTISNGLVSREIQISENGVCTVSLCNCVTGQEFVHTPLQEFYVTINGVRLTSFNQSQVSEQNGNTDTQQSGFQFLKATQEDGLLEIQLVRGNVTMGLCYKVFSGISGIEKYLWFRNDGTEDVKLEMLMLEDLSVAPGEFCDCDYYHGHQDTPLPTWFCFDGTEDIVRCHNSKLSQGWMMGTTIPGILRYFLIYPNWGNGLNGYSNGGAQFTKYVAPGEIFKTDSSLFAVYQGDKHESTAFRDLVRAVLPTPVYDEGIMYCTWIPFLKDINADLVTNLIDHAAEMGFDTFVVDDGWFAPPGDHQVDKRKFPDGLEPVAQHCIDRGMKFGLWLNIGTNYGEEGAVGQWIARDANGEEKYFGFEMRDDNRVYCMATEYREVVLKRLVNLCERYHVCYFKLDFSSVSCPYGIQPWGCHAKNHRHHHGWMDSSIEMYRSMMYVRNELKKIHPEVMVDFSFEAFGTDIPNIAALQFSEIHHVSNISAKIPALESIDRVRRCFYRWLTKLPPERILNGLLSIQGERGVEYFLTSLAGAPLVAGDLLHLDDSIRKRIKKMCDAFKQMSAIGSMTELRIVADSDDVDGFMRYGKDGHGILCVFNRTEGEFSFELPEDFAAENVETGGNALAVAPKDCAMFLLSRG
ncbi:MAG: alpha-galactosidase [Victivallales bacterium]|nr:alpha-galactosidase [Victivallales bacterium]